MSSGDDNCPFCGRPHLEHVISNVYFIRCENCRKQWDLRTGLMWYGDIPVGPKYDPATIDSIMAEIRQVRESAGR